MSRFIGSSTSNGVVTFRSLLETSGSSSSIPPSSGGQISLTSSTGGTVATGDLYIDGTATTQYTYHIFSSSGTFVSSGTGVVDILLVGGGGGGGAGQNGGSSGEGGAGGSVIVVNDAAVTSASYAVTVGGGGSSGASGTASSITGITGGVATGGNFGLGGGTNRAYFPGAGAGGPPTGTKNATTAMVGGVGLGTNFFDNLNITSVPDLLGFKSEIYNGLVYFGGGGAGSVQESSNAGASWGVITVGGAGGPLGNVYHPNSGFSVANASSIGRASIPNSGGGGTNGRRWSTQVTAGGTGGSGIVVVRYKI